MSSVVRLALLVVCGVLAAPLVAAAQFRLATPAESFDGPVALPAADVGAGTIMLDSIAPPGVPFGRGMSGYPGTMSPGGGLPYRSVRSNRPQQPQWTIPVGEYGLELADGTRMVGRPAKNWLAKIATSFGTVTIPLTQIAHIAPAGNGQFAAYLKNGDRVTGSLVSNTMNFETKFGTLSVAATDIARLRSATAAMQPVAAANPAGVRRPSRGFGKSGRVRLTSPAELPPGSTRGIKYPAPK
jgi:hypothetical protein